MVYSVVYPDTFGDFAGTENAFAPVYSDSSSTSSGYSYEVGKLDPATSPWPADPALGDNNIVGYQVSKAWFVLDWQFNYCTDTY